MSISNNHKRGKYYFSFVVIWVIYRFWGNTLFSQLNAPVIQSPDVDNTFWLLSILSIPSFIIHNQIIATLLDIMMLFLPLLYLLKPNKLYAILFTIIISLYHICFSLYAAHHFHSLMGIIIVSTVFWSDNENRKDKLWSLARYYFLFAMVSAALWKIGRGSVFDPNFMTETLKAQHAQYIFDFPNSLLTGIYKWTIDSTNFARWFYITATALELFFIVGFFTKKFDKLLAALFLIFAVANFFVMGIFSFELAFFILTLLI